MTDPRYSVCGSGYALDDNPTRTITVSGADLNAVVGTQGSDDPGDTELLPSELIDRYRDLQAYVGWTDEDAARIKSVAELVRQLDVL